MMRRRPILGPALAVALAAFLLGAAAPPAAANGAEGAREWRFGVTLDGRAIGYHHFQLRERGGQRELVSEARFNVRVLFFDAYRYVHDATELWRDDCLERIEARTDDNGDRLLVRGARDEASFVVAAAGDERTLPACVQTFAYWNPSILEAEQLLNPQTGEYVPVRVAALGREPITPGSGVMAQRYRLTGRGEGAALQIDLWYGEDQRWLGLDSVTDGGRQLSYRLL